MGKGIALTFCDVQFLSFGHIFANFHVYAPVWSKVVSILSHYQVVFNIFNFCEKALISNCSNLWQFFVEIFTIRHVDVYSVCLLSEKKRSATRFLIHDCLFFLIHDRHREYICIIRIQLYWRYPVRSFRPPAVVKQKLRYRSSSAPSLFLPPPPPYTHTHTQKGGSKRSPVIGLRTW